MTSILCLAHYCDVHGPTPLMVTEGFPVPCSACCEIDQRQYAALTDRPPSRAQTPTSSPATVAISEVLRRIDLSGAAQRGTSLPSSEQEAESQRTVLLRASHVTPSSSTAIETPPESPRRIPELQQPNVSALSLMQQPSRRESSFRKTYDDYVTKRAGPCENCALTLPQRQKPAASSKTSVDTGVPTLRTRAPCARVYGGGQETSPPNSQTSSSSVSEDESVSPSRPMHRRTGTTASSTSHSSTSSIAQRNAHTHYLDYTSTHEPIKAASFSIVRASCLRTLSFETLPRPTATSTTASGSSTTSTPTPSPLGTAFVTTHSTGSAGAGGPIFFGDPSTGYTTAFIFRIPDVHARGHKRVYAFLALSTHRERQAMKTFPLLSNAFREMAAWIQALAETEAERAYADPSPMANSPVAATATASYSSAFGSQNHPRQQTEIPGPGSSSMGGSSFLAGGGIGGISRRMAGGYGGSGGIALKQRGLAELVGLPDFFIQLHARFVKLFVDVGVELAS